MELKSTAFFQVLFLTLDVALIDSLAPEMWQFQSQTQYANGGTVEKGSLEASENYQRAKNLPPFFILRHLVGALLDSLPE